MKFAKIDEEVFSRYGELTGEEFRLYCTIFFHTFIDTGICRRNLRQLCLIHGLNYSHTTERYKILLMDFSNLTEEEKKKRGQKMKSPWCENTKKGIRPLVGLKVPKNGTPENEVFRKTEHTYSENGNTDVPKNGTFGDEMFRKTEHTYKEYIEPLKSRDFPDNNNRANSDVVVDVDGNNFLSKFSLEDCRRYVKFSIERGQVVKNPEGLAITLHQSGEADAFIEAALYPQSIQTQEIEVEKSVAAKTDDLTDALNLLIDLQANGEDITDFQKYYPPDIWARLMEEIKQ